MTFFHLLEKIIESGIYVWMLCLIYDEPLWEGGGGGGGGGGPVFLWPVNWCLCFFVVMSNSAQTILAVLVFGKKKVNYIWWWCI